MLAANEERIDMLIAMCARLRRGDGDITFHQWQELGDLLADIWERGDGDRYADAAHRTLLLLEEFEAVRQAVVDMCITTLIHITQIAPSGVLELIAEHEDHES